MALDRSPSACCSRAASVFTFSVPGLAWFVHRAAACGWSFEAIAGRSPVDWRAVRAGLAAHKVDARGAAVILVGIAVVAFTPGASSPPRSPTCRRPPGG